MFYDVKHYDSYKIHDFLKVMNFFITNLKYLLSKFIYKHINDVDI